MSILVCLAFMMSPISWMLSILFLESSFATLMLQSCISDLTPIFHKQSVQRKVPCIVRCGCDPVDFFDFKCCGHGVESAYGFPEVSLGDVLVWVD